ncbi:MAG: enoyl-CoA hydratase/isomerase family protein [Deltaproteobacteria bacterium]|nr:enoyl-CoA hydratase/isomerase family protein [Deltaproteobacteria bacterium]
MTTLKHDFKHLLVEEKTGDLSGIILVTLHRPEVLNAMNRLMLEELKEVLTWLGEQLHLRVLILTGSGDKAFVAGADISQFEKMTPAEAIEFATFGQSVFNLLEGLPQATIAALNGYALGGGSELALACDFIYAARDAKLGQPEVNLGIVPGYGGTQRLSRLIGKAMAKELIFSGKIISAEEALRIRWVNAVFEGKDLMAEVYKTAKLIASMAPRAVAESKKAIEEGYDISLGSALELECDAFSATFGTQDQKEGARAFLEKRSPKFTGR